MHVPGASSIGSVGPLQSTNNLRRAVTNVSPSTGQSIGKSGEAGEQNFSKFIGDLVEEANATQLEADDTTRELMAGNVDNIHDVVLKVAKADLSFRFLMEIRNKVTEAYQEISRMPL